MITTKEKAVLLLSLYLAQGLPGGFLTQALPAILRQYHLSQSMISVAGGILLAPWGLKFLWASFLDTHYSQKLGHSRGWILLSQAAILLFLLGVSLLAPTQLNNFYYMAGFVLVIFLMNVFSANQDVATDALAIKLMGHGERSFTNSIQVGGYRLGLIIGGGGALMTIEYIGWFGVFMLLFALVLVTTIPILRFKEPHWVSSTKKNASPLSLGDRFAQFIKPFGYFFKSAELTCWLGVLLAYRLAEGLSAGMVKPMMVDMGYSLAKIGAYATMVGSIASIVGAACAHWVLKEQGRVRGLFACYILQIMGVFLYAWVAWRFKQNHVQDAWVFVANAVEHLTAAMAMVAVLTLMMDYARSSHAARDSSLQICILFVLAGVGHVCSGFIAQYFSYTSLFVISSVVGVLCILPLWIWRKHYTPQVVAA